jgi:hypothetical protein
MHTFLVLYVVYATCGLFIALCLCKVGPWKLVLGSSLYVGFFGLAGVSMIFTSRSLNSEAFEIAGQVLLVFYAVVGGALFSAGWGELRKRARANTTRMPD